MTAQDTEIDLTTVETLPPFPKTDRQARFIELAAKLSRIAGDNAMRHDHENSFPFDTFAALREAGYLALTVPEEYGGSGASALEAILAQDQLARGDGAVALGTTMHLIQVANIAASTSWSEALRERVLREVVNEGALINSVASEPALGSPSRGGLYATTAVRGSDGWVINGRKTWSTLSPGLTYASLLLTLVHGDGQRERGTFLLPMDTPGVRIEETWDNLSMRATGSHDIVLEDVWLRDDLRVPQDQSAPASNVSAWNLLGSAVYLGVATAARDYAVTYARKRAPSALGGKTIAELESVQHRIARMEISLLQARSLLFTTAAAWDDYPERREELGWHLAAAKYTVTNNAIEITDQALRVVGSAGLQRQHPLERYFRDVRAGLGNPPLDDVALTMIGKRALDL